MCAKCFDHCYFKIFLDKYISAYVQRSSHKYLLIFT